MVQCEHIFKLDAKDHQVRCTLCGDFDDEMQLVNPELEEREEREEREDFYRTQVSFE